jgi:vacuolar-type H+-ATPase subunit D/Vma8
MRLPTLDSFSPRLKLLRAKKAELHVEITTLKAECAILRARMQKGTADPGNSQEYRARQLLGDTL